jgi:hypothetical protein
MKKRFRPTARRDGLVVQHFDNEVLVYDLEASKAFCLNKTASMVWLKCDGRRSSAEISRCLNADGIAIDERVVDFAIDLLACEKLVESGTECRLLKTTRSRREAIRQLGMASALLPIVASVVAPAAAQVGSCLAVDTPCTMSSQCCSNCCKDVGGGIQQCKPGGGACLP